MPGISDTTSSIQGIFSLDVITAILAFLLLVAATVIVLTRVVNGRIRSFSRSSDAGPLKTTLSTHLCLIPALICLAVAYAIQSAVVALQANSGSPASVTSVYSYPFATEDSTNGYQISNLTFTQQLATILSTTFLTAAVWLHSNNLTTNGTKVNSPGTLSRIWNALILTAILAFGLATWGQGLSVRGSSPDSLTYPSTINSDRITRILYIIFRCVVIFTSTSVSIEVLRNLANLKKNGKPDNTERPLLARFAYVVVPIIFLRNVFIIVNIVLIYQDYTTWSTPTNQALAFLLIIFGQLANLTILCMVLWGAWKMGKSGGKAVAMDG